MLALVAVLAALAVTAPATAQTEGTTKCVAYAVLKPGNEVRPPDTTHPVESRAAGAALVAINGTRLSFSVAIVNPARETFIAGHIHIGAAGTNGSVVVPLFMGSTSTRLILQADRLTISEDLAADICGDLGGYYVNYHTTQDRWARSADSSHGAEIRWERGAPRSHPLGLGSRSLPASPPR